MKSQPCAIDRGLNYVSTAASIDPAGDFFDTFYQDTQWDLSFDVPVLLQAAFTLPILGLVLTVWLAINVVLHYYRLIGSYY
ncbi:hypothetical protein DOE73_11190 [Paenibacillus dendritiformis]|nr:hypothetical protein DOE73_11190 [Paenibacillus dendritiformis]